MTMSLLVAVGAAGFLVFILGVVRAGKADKIAIRLILIGLGVVITALILGNSFYTQSLLSGK